MGALACKTARAGTIMMARRPACCRGVRRATMMEAVVPALRTLRVRMLGSACNPVQLGTMTTARADAPRQAAHPVTTMAATELACSLEVAPLGITTTVLEPVWPVGARPGITMTVEAAA